MDPLEERFYAQAAGEIATKALSPGIMGKALADSEGDEKKAVSLYIKYRVQQLKDEHLANLVAVSKHQKELELQREQDKRSKLNKMWTICVKCNFEGSMDQTIFPGSGHTLWTPVAKCPKCKHRFDWYYAEPKS